MRKGSVIAVLLAVTLAGGASIAVSGRPTNEGPSGDALLLSNGKTLAVGLVGAQPQSPGASDASDAASVAFLSDFLLRVLVFPLISGTLVAGVYVAIAWWIARKFGTRWLVATCLVATLLLWLEALTLLEASPSPRVPHPLLALSFLGGAFGFATFSVRRHLRASAGGALTLRSTKAGVGAWFVGALIGLIPSIATDLAAKFR